MMLVTTPFRWVSQFFFGFFFVYGIYLPFWALWLAQKGMDSSQVGLLVGAAFATRCVANLLLTPRLHNIERLIPTLRILVLVGITSLVLFSAFQDFYWYLVVTVLFNFSIGPTMPLTDALANYYSNLRLLDYGHSRLWGSVSFIVGSILVGELAAKWGERAVFYTALVGIIVLFLLSMCSPLPLPRKVKSEKGEKPESVFRLLKNRSVLLFLALVSCVQGSHSAYYGFSTIHWQSIGYSEETIGYLWGLGVLGEIVVFGISKKVFTNWTVRGLFVLSSCAIIGRWAITAVASEFYALALAQGLHGLTFAAAHIAAVRYIQLAPVRLAVPLQALYNALPLGLVVAVLTPISGWGFEHVGSCVFWGMSFMGLLALSIPVHFLGSGNPEKDLR